MNSVIDIAPPNLTNLISSYSILTTLSSWISTIDLYHLALTSRTHHSFILASPQIFQVLTRQSLCDGRGLADRQEFRGLYKIYDFDKGSKIIQRDEPVEVRLYNLKCDETSALPCVKCGVNLWCMCGETIPRDTRMRCTWCKRRHLPEEDWFDEWETIGSKMPWFDDDPDYPHWQTDRNKYPVPYPKLGYTRPGD
ncbi:hypothetical protein CEP53_000566 [Fusarium sp. AF-6]|nr:hypothetical protein CEP53_000566 [Fusarium sp. AF-6]